jgi:hypothetical protein
MVLLALQHPANALATRRDLVQDSAPMSRLFSDADVLTSARMAAGMTSRARRPDLPPLAG